MSVLYTRTLNAAAGFLGNDLHGGLAPIYLPISLGGNDSLALWGTSLPMLFRREQWPSTSWVFVIQATVPSGEIARFRITTVRRVDRQGGIRDTFGPFEWQTSRTPIQTVFYTFGPYTLPFTAGELTDRLQYRLDIETVTALPYSDSVWIFGTNVDFENEPMPVQALIPPAVFGGDARTPTIEAVGDCYARTVEAVGDCAARATEAAGDAAVGEIV